MTSRGKTDNRSPRIRNDVFRFIWRSELGLALSLFQISRLSVKTWKGTRQFCENRKSLAARAQWQFRTRPIGNTSRWAEGACGLRKISCNWFEDFGMSHTHTIGLIRYLSIAMSCIGLIIRWHHVADAIAYIWLGWIIRGHSTPPSTRIHPYPCTLRSRTGLRWVRLRFMTADNR